MVLFKNQLVSLGLKNGPGIPRFLRSSERPESGVTDFALQVGNRSLPPGKLPQTRPGDVAKCDFP